MTACKICKTKTSEFIARNKVYYSCPDCEFIFLDKKFIVSKQDQIKRYNLHQNSINDKGYVDMLSNFIDVILQNSTQKIKYTLDYGCGKNPVLKQLLLKRDFDVDVYDKYYFPEKLYQNKKYDLITSTEVFEHLENPIKTINELITSLGENGIIAIMTNFIPKTSFENWWYISDETHISFYSKKTFEFIANKFNLDIIYCNNKNIIILKKK